MAFYIDAGKNGSSGEIAYLLTLNEKLKLD